MFGTVKERIGRLFGLRRESATAESSPEGIALSGYLWLDRFYREAGEYNSILRDTNDLQERLGPQERSAYKTAGLWRKRFEGVANRPYEILPGGDRPADMRAAEICQMAMDELPDKISVLEDMAKAQLYGFSVSEVIWDTHRGMWLPRELRPKRRARFRFHAMDGNYELRLLSLYNTYEGDPVSPRKFLINRGLSDAENPYGMPEGLSVYIIQQVGHYGLTYWESFVRMFGAPYVRGTVTGNAPPLEKQRFLEALEWFRRTGVMVTSENQQVDFPSVAIPAGNNVHKEFQTYLDDIAAQVILGENLTTSSGERGARSLGEVHQSVSERKARGDCLRVEETMRNLFRWITEFNVGKEVAVPKLAFEFDDAADKLTRANIAKTLWEIGAIPQDPVAYVLRNFGFSMDPAAAQRLLSAGGNMPMPAEKAQMLAASLNDPRVDRLSRALNGKLDTESAAAAKDATDEYAELLARTLDESPEDETADAFAARFGAALDRNENIGDIATSVLVSAGLAARDRALKGE